MDFSEPVEDVTVVIPFMRGGNERWLEEAKGGFAHGQKLVVVENEGEMAEALNDAIINHVETDWVYRFDADDIAPPGLVHMLRDAVWDGADGAYPSMIIATTGQVGDDPDALITHGIHHADAFCPRRLETHNYISGASLFRRSMFVEVGGYRDLLALEDWDLWLRMSRETGARFKPVPEAFFYYRQVGGSRNKLSVKLGQKLADEISGENPASDAIATFYYGGTPMTAHVRCAGPAKHMPALLQPVYSIPHVEHEEQPAIRFPHHRGSAAIVQFGATQMDSLTFRWLQLNGIPLFVEVDDNYTVIGGRLARKAGWQANVLEKDKKTGEVILERQRPSTEGHLRIVKSADGIICSTEYLAEQYRKHHDNVWVCPNQVEPSEWPDPPMWANDGIYRIGWFASSSHNHDWPMVAKALKWAAKQKGVRVVLMGIEIADPGFDHVYLPWHDDWGIYRLALGQLDVGLAPVAPSPFFLGRSDLKALDYSMAGATSILQDERPYENWTHGENCLKARTPDDFLKMVKYCVYNKARAREIAAEARRYTLEERTFEGNAHLWKAAIASRTAIAA